MNNTLPENFRKIIVDFITDLSTTYPEYSFLWNKWKEPELPENELVFLFNYLLKVFPERFFDILYENEDIFDIKSPINTVFLPNVDFKLLYNCKDISSTTKTALWKYLQLILMCITSSIQNKTNFGDTLNLFDGIDEKDLQEKINETINNIGSFFTNINEEETTVPLSATNNTEENNTDETEEGNNTEECSKGDAFSGFKNMFKDGNIPNAESLQEHLKFLLEGKIGGLAKELAAELSTDFSDMFSEGADIKSTQDVFKKIIKNPKKIMELIKKVGSKLEQKMKSGDINQQDLMTEAHEFMKKMKAEGGMDGFKDILKNMGLGKNAKIDMNKLNELERQFVNREKMREKLQKNREAKLQATQNPNKFIYQTDEKQEKTPIQQKEEIDKLMEELNIKNEIISVSGPIQTKKSSGGKKKQKKGKK
jgi:hypothetical protein